MIGCLRSRSILNLVVRLCLHLFEIQILFFWHLAQWVMAVDVENSNRPEFS
jgi:hypothetical protein